MVFTREVDSMINKLQKLTMTTGVLALVFILPMALSAVISKTAGGNGITENYCSPRMPPASCLQVMTKKRNGKILFMSP